MSESTTPPLDRLREMLNTDNTEGQFDCRVSAGVRNLFYQRRGNSLTWVLQWTASGKLQTMGLGPASDDRRKEVGRLVAKYQEMIKVGGDPQLVCDEELRAAGLQPVRSKPAVAEAARTFRDAARFYLVEFEDRWKSDHALQWAQKLRDYVYPVIGDVPVGRRAAGQDRRRPHRASAGADPAHQPRDGQEGAQPQ